jgi:phage shock protein PspC (stress-responsive transcriptional regulator)
MKKTNTNSIGGIVFHIEEDAQIKLSAYLDAIRSSLSNSEGRDEIMSDIESRIAEILQPKVTGYKQVVTIDDVEDVIRTMGSPADFSTGGSEAKEEVPFSTKEKGRQQYGHRRIFRDPDDKVISGVCSGMAYYFGIDPIWLRLGFGLSLFIGGFGFILYILLIFIIPKAKTTAEKLEMRGEPVDLNSIKKSVEEEMNDIKKKMTDYKNEFKNGDFKNRARSTGNKVGDFFGELGHGLGNLIGGVIKGVFAFIGFILVLVFTCLLVALVVSLWSGMNVIHIESHNGHYIHYSVHNIFSMFAITGTTETIMMVGLFLFLCVPLIALIVRMGRAVIGADRNPKWFKTTILIAWMTGLAILLVGSMSAIGHFSVTGRASTETKFAPSATAKVLYLTVPENDENDGLHVGIDSLNFYVNDDNLFQGNPSICVSASPDTNFHVILNKSARGISTTEATQATNNIEYSFSQHDSVLQLNPSFTITEGTPWRRQKLEVLLEVPVNKTIAMPEGIDHIVCSTIHHQHHRLGGHQWTMTASGLVETQPTTTQNNQK